MNSILFRITTIHVVITVVIINMCLAQFRPQFQVQSFGQNQFEQRQFASSASQNRQQQQFQRLQQNQVDFREPQSSSGAGCPERNGRFVVSGQCDAYIECVDGIGEQKLCPEGLYFNPEARFNYPCGYPIDIKCDDRPNLQQAQPTEECPHQYGYFKVGDETNCGQFVNCADGVAYHINCPEGLAFNSESYRCDWPDQVPDCNAEAFLKFSCPLESNNQFFVSETRIFRNPNDCQRYFICVNGRPRLQNCGEGNAFNEFTNTCDAAENVTGCGFPNVESADRFDGRKPVPPNGFVRGERLRLF